MKDWKGNEIQVGHTVLVVNAAYESSDVKVIALIHTEDGWKPWGSPEPTGYPAETSYNFEVAHRYQITEPGFEVRLQTKDEPGLVPINIIGFWIYKQPGQIICIEGVSDNRDEYYEHYFKA